MNHDNNNTNYPITRFYKNYGLEKKKVLKWLSDMVMSDMGYTNSVCNLGQFACFDGRGCVPNENVRKFFISDFSKNTGYFFQVCDSVFQCMDGSDEKYCAPKQEDAEDNDNNDVEDDVNDEGTGQIVN